MRETDRQTDRRTYLSQPVGHPVLAVAANVRVDDDDGEERRQRYEDHVDTEVHTWRIAAHTEASFHHNNKRAIRVVPHRREET